MKYRVIGSNRDTGARMVLEFEAESKAAAERKAAQQGMSVNRVEDITAGEPAHTGVDYSGRRSGGGGKIKMLIVLLIILAGAFYAWRNEWLPI